MEMFRHEFMQHAFQASFLIAVIAPLLGLFLVLRRQSLMADTLSHISLAGVALGMFVNVNPTVTTLIVVVIAAVAIEYVRSLYKTYSEVSIAVLMSAGLSIALVLMSLDQGSGTASVQQYLFGSIVTISREQVYLLAVLFAIVVTLFFLFRKPMYVLTFDEDTAFTAGLPTRLMSLLFNVITGVTIAVIMPIAGALLVSAIMILPAAIAMRLSKSFNWVMLMGVVVGLIGMFGGLTTSYEFGTPPGATITLIFIVIFIFSGVIGKLIAKFKKKNTSN
ncbi:zinc ABC transporter permease [Carnobacterium maltaromaticum]|uniref:metal ABC transporter permease n=1 Tax=Carnobacterium maltaromaticum TaxID=2751 RepID=UPI000C76C82B|nr:metal ABC transporter permease [Carnobacterium maltaromaticum]PLS33021.1 zinc ABC transporter permease [Carnobacterium maltaromaticum]PLS33486.1 zinc ABC transporter permease [Carnobacterium maltaromaticum]PLS33596.1 zinc ABC transporter permease [Carnobacterium maltaromaticum]PLS41369.1 zinc ABC transporter permease [Carnobacterium maltaromaticum]PLS42177.1 zinc ABC transporter permease [Carnobacterium maltaromaticum]